MFIYNVLGIATLLLVWFWFASKIITCDTAGLISLQFLDTKVMKTFSDSIQNDPEKRKQMQKTMENLPRL